MRFVDEVEIVVASGRGGDGIVSFRREAHVPRGGPDGGDGGKGGDLHVEASKNRTTLVDLRWNRRYEAESGKSGDKNKMAGRWGADLVLLVPVGTVIYDAETGERLADLDHDGSRWTLRGGQGGRGNVWFKSATMQTPLHAEEGRPAKERRIRMELKLIADVGLVGFPNAGKSTFISRVSAARPKIADYPFTTLTPQLGVVSVTDGESFVIADIPGLIEGAADGRGLGHQFLRHVERCPLLVHLVAPHQPEGDPVQCLRVLDGELERYAAELAKRPRIVVLTKIDTLDAEERAFWVEQLAVATGERVFAMSSVSGEGVREIVFEIARRLRIAREDGPMPPVRAWIPTHEE